MNVGQSAIIPEFQRRPRNDTLVAVISFFETKGNYKGPDQLINEGGGS